MNCLRTLWNDDAGVIISAELVLILTIVVIGVIVGLVQVRDAVVIELHDVSRAICGLNQSYGFAGFHGWLKPGCGFTSWTAGSSFIDVFDGTTAISVSDIGIYSESAMFGMGGVAVMRVSTYGCIVLADGTLIPLTWVASGTWSCPGGLLLAATSANATMLRLADGTLIPFLYGRPGTVVFADGTVVVVRPGLDGTLVLSDGRVAIIDVNDSSVAVLADGTRVTFRVLELDVVVLSDGTIVRVESAAQSVLTLQNGSVIDLHKAVLPPGMDVQQILDPDCPTHEPCDSIPGVAPQPTPLPEATEPQQPVKEPAKTRKTVMAS